MSAYDALAASYDGLMADGAYRRRAAFLERRLKKSRIPVHTILDLACGTGTMACLLAERGYEVLAADGSGEMLTQAAEKAAELEHPPLFLLQAMPKLRLVRPVDAVVSTLDSLNYLTRERDLQETLRRVRRWLKPGGLFLFDVNTPEKLEALDGQVFLDETEDAYCVWRTEFSKRSRICSYFMDIFRLDPAAGRWDRGEELHRERAYTPAELTAMLEAAGFTGVRAWGERKLRPPKPGEQRIFFTARKDKQ